MNHASGGTVAEGREHEAVTNARQRLELQKQAVGERHPEYATGLNQLALLLIMHGDPERAEPLLRQALEIRKDALGEKHPDYATNLSSLAGLLWARGDLDGAEPLLRKALEVRWEVLGSGHAKSIASLNSLEQLLRAKQDWEGIERLTADPGAKVQSAPAPAPPSAPTPAPASSRAAAAPAQPAPAKPPELERPPVAPPAPPAAAKPPVEPPPAKAKVDLPRPAPPRAEPPPPAKPAPAPAAAAVEATVMPQSPTPAPAAKPAPARAETRPAAKPAAAEAKPADAAASGPSRVELADRLDKLGAEFARLGERLAGEAEEWKAGGVPPSQALIDDLGRSNREFERLRDAVAQLSGSLGTPVQASGLTNLQMMSALLEKLAEAEGRRAQLEAVRAQALGVLDRVLTLAHPDQKEFAPLVSCQAKARDRRAAIAGATVLELPDEATELAEGGHAFNALLTLVEGEGLDDDLWADSLEAVEAEFGKPLSVAVARSKIVAPASA